MTGRLGVAYVNSEYGLIVSDEDEWQDIEDTIVWGFYGDDYAAQAALEALEGEK